LPVYSHGKPLRFQLLFFSGARSCGLEILDAGNARR
jgi:hypothetical protein